MPIMNVLELMAADQVPPLNPSLVPLHKLDYKVNGNFGEDLIVTVRNSLTSSSGHTWVLLFVIFVLELQAPHEPD